MTSTEYRVFAATLAVVAVVCLATTGWAVYDLLSQPFAWSNAATVAFGVVVTAAITAGASYLRRRAHRTAQAEQKDGRS